MGALHNEILGKSSETPADLATATLTIKAAKLSRARRVTVWVFPLTQAITVTLRAALLKAGALAVDPQVGPITGAVFGPDLVAVVAAADAWTPITFDHLMPGDLLIDVIAGADNPTSVEVVVVGSVD